MILFKQLARVRMARRRVAMARDRLGTPASALLARGRRHPLTALGAAAGAGFVLGSLNVQPLRVPGLSALLGGGLNEAVSWAARLIAELATLGLAAQELDSQGAPDGADSESS